jgi:hypothetical protein
MPLKKKLNKNNAIATIWLSLMTSINGSLKFQINLKNIKNLKEIKNLRNISIK